MACPISMDFLPLCPYFCLWLPCLEIPSYFSIRNLCQEVNIFWRVFSWNWLSQVIFASCLFAQPHQYIFVSGPSAPLLHFDGPPAIFSMSFFAFFQVFWNSLIFRLCSTMTSFSDIGLDYLTQFHLFGFSWEKFLFWMLSIVIFSLEWTKSAPLSRFYQILPIWTNCLYPLLFHIFHRFLPGPYCIIPDSFFAGFHMNFCSKR